MRLIVGLVLAAGVGLGGVAVYMAQGQIAQFQLERDYLVAAQAKAPRLSDIVVVKRQLKYGERFSAADLEVIKVQAGKTPEGAFTRISAPQGSPEAATSVFVDGETRPRSAMRTYEANEPLLAKKVTDAGTDAGILANLSADMRAFTIRVDVSSGVSGFLRPGDLVDVYWSGAIGDQPVTKLIHPNLRLIAIDQSADADRTEETLIARTVTAEVTPEQVAALTLAQSTGRLTLSLLGRNNTASAGPIEIDRDSLLGIEQAEVVKVDAPKVCTVKTRRGNEIVETPIPCTN